MIETNGGFCEVENEEGEPGSKHHVNDVAGRS